MYKLSDTPLSCLRGDPDEFLLASVVLTVQYHVLIPVDDKNACGDRRSAARRQARAKSQGERQPPLRDAPRRSVCRAMRAEQKLQGSARQPPRLD